jgi:hypothetical protein
MEGNFEQVQTLSRGFYAHLSPTTRARYLCFFPGDSDFQPYEPINYLAELVAMDRSGRPDFEAAEMHVTNEPMQAVLQDKPTQARRAPVLRSAHAGGDPSGLSPDAALLTFSSIQFEKQIPYNATKRLPI